MYTHSITVKMMARTIKIMANGTVHPPKAYETVELTNEKIAKKSKNKIARVNEIIGIYLGKQ